MLNIEGILERIAGSSWQELLQVVSPSELVDTLIATLNEQLAGSLVVEPKSIDSSSGDVTAVATEKVCGSFGKIEVVARIYVLVYQQANMQATADLFVFINGERVSPRGLDFIGHTFDLGARNRPYWSVDGWQVDEYGEYGDVSPL